MGRVMRRSHGEGKEVQGLGIERSYGNTTRVSGERNAERNKKSDREEAE